MENNVLIPTNGPAAVVDYIIKVEGEEVPAAVKVLTISVMKEINRIPKTKIVILDGNAASEDFLISNEEYFIPGKTIEILAGFVSERQLIFKGVIVKHGVKIRPNGQSHLKIDCMDAAFKTTIAKHNRYFSEATDAEAIEQILDEYELDKEIDAMEVTHPELVQFESTDWNFIVSRAEANGHLCFISDGNFVVKSPNLSAEPVLSLQYGASLLAFDAEIDARVQYPTVKTSSWDYARQELTEIEASSSSFEEPGNIDSIDLAAVSGLESLDLRHSGQMEPEELQAWADACLLKSKLAKIQGRARFQGFAGILPGDLILLQGVGKRFNGKAFVSGIRHEISAGNWVTDAQLGFSAKWFSEQMQISSLPASGLLPSIQGLHMGIVTQLAGDPNEENRILVRVPIINTEEEGIWARLATLDAGTGDGAGRGMFFLPEIDDEVIVGFINGDPRDPVVLGMLHSSAKPAPLQASDDNHEKGYVSRSDMKLLFNDEKKSVQLETPAGKKILLDEDQGAIKMEDENGNKIVMDSSGILIESAADLILKAGGNLQTESSANLELKAGANFKAEGTAGAEVSTSAIAVLKGSLVQIN